MLDDLAKLNNFKLEETGDPEIATRISQYEMAFRMQASVPELTDISQEPKHVLDMYGPEATQPGSFAYNCLLARRLAERGVRFIQLYHRAWDHHAALPKEIRKACLEADQPSARIKRNIEEFLLDRNIRRFLQAPGGPITRIMRSTPPVPRATST